MKSKERHVIAFGPGGVLGAQHYGVAARIVRNHGWPVRCLGGSVGVLNAALLCQQDVRGLYKLWRQVDGQGFFQRPNLDIWNGLFNLNPLRRKLRKHVSLKKMSIPMSIGHVDLDAGEYVTVHTDELETDDELYDAMIASCTICGYHDHADYEGHACADTGFLKLWPELPDPDTYDAIHALLCTPLDGFGPAAPGTYNRLLRAMEGSMSLTIEIALDELPTRRCCDEGADTAVSRHLLKVRVLTG